MIDSANRHTRTPLGKWIHFEAPADWGEQLDKAIIAKSRSVVGALDPIYRRTAAFLNEFLTKTPLTTIYDPSDDIRDEQASYPEIRSEVVFHERKYPQTFIYIEYDSNLSEKFKELNDKLAKEVENETDIRKKESVKLQGLNEIV